MDILKGVTMVPFAREMRKTCDSAAKAMSDEEFNIYCGYQYGLMAAGVKDHRISDGAIAAAQAVRYAYSG